MKMSRFSRESPKYRQQPKVLVVCEDKKSSKNYLEDASRFFKCKVSVEIIHCGNTDPLGIVNYSINKQKQFDYIFCVIDKDAHANFNEATEVASNYPTIKIIASYPCFEFWLLLHFGYTRKPYSASGGKSAADILIKDLKNKATFLSDYDKGKTKDIFKSLESLFEAAYLNSERAFNEAIRENEMNPCTELHELLRFFRLISEPHQIPTMLVVIKKLDAIEKDYINDFCINQLVKIHRCEKNDPIEIIEEANKRKKDFKLIYCVIDDFENNYATAENVKVISKNELKKLLSPQLDFLNINVSHLS